VKLVHLVGFITKKFVTMYGHTNVKFQHVTFVIDGIKILSNVSSSPNDMVSHRRRL